MKLDKNDINFLETYDNLQFYFESGILNYFVEKYGVVGVLNHGDRYLGSYEYSLKLDNLTINFSASLNFNLLEGEDCLKVDSYGIEIFDNISNDIFYVEDPLEEQTKKYIYNSVKRYYFKAIELGAILSDVSSVGANLYKVNIGNCELTYLGTADGTASIVGSSGDFF